MARGPKQARYKVVPVGMAPSADPGNLPSGRVRVIQGFLPGRAGVLKLSHALRPLRYAANDAPICGLGLYYKAHVDTEVGQFPVGVERDDRLLTVENGTRLMQNRLVWTEAGGDAPGRPGLHVEVGADQYVGDLPEVLNKNGNPTRVRFLQYKTDLIIVREGGMCPRRYWVDNERVAHLTKLGIDPPANAPTLLAGGVGLTGDYLYAYTYADERGRESGASPLGTVTLANQSCTVTTTCSHEDMVGFDSEVRTIEVYRSMADGDELYFLSSHANDAGAADISFVDSLTDADLDTTRVLPVEGQNGRPAPASVATIWRDRLILNDTSLAAVEDSESISLLEGDRWAGGGLDESAAWRIQVSNQGSPTQFALYAPEAETDGWRTNVGDEEGDEITALATFGSALGIWKRRAMYLMTGTGSALDWQIQRVNSRGCVSPDSVVQTDYGVTFLSEDGIYITDGFSAPVKLSDPDIDTLLYGYAPDGVGDPYEGRP